MVVHKLQLYGIALETSAVIQQRRALWKSCPAAWLVQGPSNRLCRALRSVVYGYFNKSMKEEWQNLKTGAEVVRREGVLLSGQGRLPHLVR